MDLKLNDEQRLLQESVRRFVTRDCDFESRRQQVTTGGFSPRNWEIFLEQGWLAAGLPENAGGFGGSLIESCLVTHELGRGLVLEPYLVVAVLTASTLLVALSSADRARYLEPLVSGERFIVLAHQESGQSLDLAHVEVRAKEKGGTFQISGTKKQILGGAQASTFLVSARTSNNDTDVDGISLFQVPADSAGLAQKHYRLIDGTPVADIVLDNVVVDKAALVGTKGGAYVALEYAHDHATIALCAQAVGAMERAIEITTEYLRIRKQFGVPIGSFQALQHRLADMLIELEQTRVMVYRALSHAESDSLTRKLAVSATKVQMGNAARFIGSQAIQLHGGIGVTEEYSIGHFFKFLCVCESIFGTTSKHLNTLAASLQHLHAEI